MDAEAMSSLEVWLIIALVIGVILSNLAVLKYSAKFKMPQFGEPKKENGKPNLNAEKPIDSVPSEHSVNDQPLGNTPSGIDTDLNQSKYQQSKLSHAPDADNIIPFDKMAKKRDATSSLSKTDEGNATSVDNSASDDELKR